MSRTDGSLARHTLDLARRYWAPVVCVYLAGTFLNAVMVRGIATLGLEQPILGLLALSLALLVTLATTILMFHMLRPGLPQLNAELEHRSGDSARAGLAERERRVVDAVSTTILPFLVFYSAWGLIKEEYRDYVEQAQQDSGPVALGAISDFDPLGMPLLVCAGMFGARVLFGRLYERTKNSALGLVTAVCEAAWAYFAVITVAQLLAQGRAWLTGRVVWAELASSWSAVVSWLADLTALPLEWLFAAVLAEVWSLLKDGLMEPLLWLTVAAIVFGSDINRADGLFEGRPRIRKMVRETTQRVPTPLVRLAEVASMSLRDKYVPLLNALRFVLTAGPVFLVTFCVYYALVEAGASWLHRGIYLVVGPADYFSWWWPWVEPIERVVDTVQEFLRVCLLAAAFDIALHRMRRTTRGRRHRARGVDRAGA